MGSPITVTEYSVLMGFPHLAGIQTSPAHLETAPSSQPCLHLAHRFPEVGPNTLLPTVAAAQNGFLGVTRLPDSEDVFTMCPQGLQLLGQAQAQAGQTNSVQLHLSLSPRPKAQHILLSHHTKFKVPSHSCTFFASG